jgi:hypothetical protein
MRIVASSDDPAAEGVMISMVLSGRQPLCACDTAAAVASDSAAAQRIRVDKENMVISSLGLFKWNAKRSVRDQAR